MEISLLDALCDPHKTSVGIAMFPASVIGGWLWDHISPSATFYFGAITASLSAILFVVFIAVVRRNSYPK
jgi:predicted MFS family arabinose efflux permease